MEETIVKIGNGTGLKSTKIGTSKPTMEQTDETKIDVTLKFFTYVPKLSTNLVSITKVMENSFEVSSKGNIMSLSKGLKMVKSTTNGTLNARVKQTDRTKINVTLENVTYVPELSTNQFSITKAIENSFEVSSIGNNMSPSKGSNMVRFDKLQKTKSIFCL
jgi:hypothetical protein